jgi:hypothetical protein
LGKKEHEVRIIRHWYTNRHAAAQKRLQETVEAISFSHIVEEGRHDDELAWLLDRLAQERRPACIMDDLWFIHALNGALPRLFEVNPHSAFFSHWAAWHTIGVKFSKLSPVREKHDAVHAVHGGIDPMLPAVMKLFFEDPRTYPYLFTRQMGMLIDRLLQLSADEAYPFHDWFYQVLSFSLPYKLRAMPRTIIYRKQPIDITARLRDRIETEVAKGYPVGYTLSVWSPVGTDARKVFAEIEDHTIYYAATYDTAHTFHVNDWPEMQEQRS